jgi:hypothetical protein
LKKRENEKGANAQKEVQANCLEIWEQSQGGFAATGKVAFRTEITFLVG